MSGRILTERLLATTSLAALILAATGSSAFAIVPCTVTDPGGNASNSGAIACVVIDNSATTSLTNTATGIIGPPTSGSSAVSVRSGATMAGGIVNAGRIVGRSSTFTSAGIGVEGLVQGGISNSGTITVNASNAGSIEAYGVQIGAVTTISSFGGGLSNGGTIAVTARGTGVHGDGIIADVTTFSGSVTNNGTISLNLTATTGGASGIGLGVSATTFSGSNIVNSGTISVTGNAATSSELTGLGVDGFTTAGAPSVLNGGSVLVTANAGNATASAVGVSLFSFVGGFSSVSNAGVIGATATTTSTDQAGATGVSLFSGALTSGFANSGTIFGNATQSGTGTASAAGAELTVYTWAGGFSNSGTISATAMAASGSAIALGAGIDTFNTSLAGGIFNSGTIAGVATSTNGSAHAYGLTISGSVFSGGLSNGGTISANATGATNVTGNAAVVLSFSTFSGGIVNSGTITGVATSTSAIASVYGISIVGSVFSGGLNNGGIVSSRATAGGFASGDGIGFRFSTFSGGFLNTGAISGIATSTGNEAAADGVSLGGALFTGGLSNGGTISGIATGKTGALACGLSLFASSFSGGLSNSGTILASATATVSGGVEAIGFWLGVSTFTGGLTNSGTITAHAAAAAGTAIAFALDVSSNFAGNIVNSGTIAGSASAPVGYGIGILVGGGHGTITNSGLIEGSTTGIDVSNANGAMTINQTGGTIMGGPVASGCGGAIELSFFKDNLNIRGGAIVGDIVGHNASATTGNIVNVTMGSGNTFSYAGQITNVGVVNVNSGRFLLQNLTEAGVMTTNYNQSAGSTLALEVSPSTNAASNHASLSASGAISLASGSVLQAFEGAFAWTPGTYTYAGVVNAGSTTGTFTAASNSPFFTASLAQSSTVDNLTLTMLSPSQVPGLNGNQVSVANAIIGISGGNATLDQLFELPNPGPALTQLSGSQFTTTNYQPLLEAWQMFSDTLSDRLSQGDGYGGTVSASLDPSHGIQFAQADVPQQVAQMSDAGHGPASAPHRWGAWARGYGLSSNAGSTATSAAYSESGAGLIIGADNQITDRIVAGIALNVSTDKATVSGGGFTQTNAYQGSVYGQYAVDPNWYVNGIAGFGWQHYSTARVVNLLTTNVNNGNFDGQSYRLYGETGYALHPAFLPQTRITPYLGLGYLHVHADSFTETGSATALSVQAMDPNSFTTTLGARAATSLQIGTTVFHPELRVGWQHEFLDEAGTIRAAFATAPGSAVFTATGTGFGSDSFLGGAGITTTITSSTQVFLDYDAKVTGGYTAQAVSGGLRVQF